MTRQFCDRCGAEVTGRKSGAVTGVSDADMNGNGQVTEAALQLCGKCYRAVWQFVRKAPK